MDGTELPLPEKLPEPVPFGGFGKGVKRLTLIPFIMRIIPLPSLWFVPSGIWRTSYQ